MRRLLCAAAALAVAAVGVSGCDAPAAVGGKSELEKSYDKCMMHSSGPSSPYSIADGGKTLIGENVKGDDDITDLACVFVAIGTPQSIVAEMDSTTAMMGRQEEESGDYKYAWSYHPDEGMQIVVTQK